MSLHGLEKETSPCLDNFSNQAKNRTRARTPGIYSVANYADSLTVRKVDRNSAVQYAGEIYHFDTIWYDFAKRYSRTTGLFTSYLKTLDASTSLVVCDYVDRPRISLTRSVRKNIVKSAYT